MWGIKGEIERECIWERILSLSLFIFTLLFPYLVILFCALPASFPLLLIHQSPHDASLEETNYIFRVPLLCSWHVDVLIYDHYKSQHHQQTLIIRQRLFYPSEPVLNGPHIIISSSNGLVPLINFNNEPHGHVIIETQQWYYWAARKQLCFNHLLKSTDMHSDRQGG